MWVVKLGGSLCAQGEPTAQPARASGAARAERETQIAPLRDWLAMLADAGASRVVIVPGGGRFADAVRQAQTQWRFDDLAAHNMALLAMAQTAHLFCALNPALQRCDEEARLADVLQRGRTAVWSPIDLQRDRQGADTGWDTSSDSIALGLALRLRATRLIVVKSCTVDASATLAQLSAAGIVDRRFAALAAAADAATLRIDIVQYAQCDELLAVLQAERSGGH